MRTLWHPLAPLMALLVVLLSGPGCGERDANRSGLAVHVDPPHWPSDFPDAVDRLLAAQEQAREDLASGAIDAARDDRFPVLRDLAVWLPEVAADSDMPEEPWNRVNRLAERLVNIYEPILGELNAGRSVPEDRLAAADPLLAELRRERDAADPSWFPPPPSGLNATAPEDSEPVEEMEVDLAPDETGEDLTDSNPSTLD